MGKHTEQIAQTKEKLENAFWELYETNKIEKITVRAITEKSGKNRTTFYAYFSDVYQILEEKEQQILQEHRKTMEQVFLTEDIISAQKQLFQFLNKNIKFLAVLLGPDGDPNFQMAFKNNLVSFLQERLNQEEINSDIKIAIEIFSGAIISMIQYWYHNQDTISLPEVFAAGVTLMQNGALPLLNDLNIPFLKQAKGATSLL